MWGKQYCYHRMSCQVPHPYAPFASIRRLCLENLLGGLVMLSWSLQQQDFHQLIFLRREAMGLFTVGYYQMVRPWLWSSISLLAHREIKSSALKLKCWAVHSIGMWSCLMATVWREMQGGYLYMSSSAMAPWILIYMVKSCSSPLRI